MQKKAVPVPDIKNESRTNSQELRSGVKLFFALAIVFSATATLPFFNISPVPSFARKNGLIFVTLGLIALLVSERSNLKFNKFLSSFTPFVVVGFLSSILMSFLLTGNVGTIAGETPLSAITTGLMWLVFNAAIVFFASYCYAHCTGEFLDRVLDILLIFVLLVSGIQVLVMLGFPGASAIFNLINLGDWFRGFKYVAFERLVGVGSEPAAMAKTLGLFCLPYCYCRAANGGGVRYGVAFALLLFFAFLTKATSVYVTVAFVLLGILLLHMRKAKSKVVIVGVSFFCAALLFAVLVASFTGGQLVSTNTVDTFEAVLGKIGNTGNQSTAYRTSTIVNDIEIFKDYPIFGVGDGNQGFFYAQNLPSWVLNSGSTEALVALSGSIGALNGGAFLPSIISGYGIVGCMLFGAWIVFCIRTAIRRKKELGRYYDMFIVAMFACIPVCWMAEEFQGAPVDVFLIFCMPALGGQR